MWSPDGICNITHYDEETQEILKQCNSHDRVCLLFEWLQNHIVLGHAQDIAHSSGKASMYVPCSLIADLPVSFK